MVKSLLSPPANWYCTFLVLSTSVACKSKQELQSSQITLQGEGAELPLKYNEVTRQSVWHIVCPLNINNPLKNNNNKMDLMMNFGKEEGKERDHPFMFFASPETGN